MAFCFNFPDPGDSSVNEMSEQQTKTGRPEGERVLGRMSSERHIDPDLSVQQKIPQKESAREILMEDVVAELPNEITITTYKFNNIEVQCYNSSLVENFVCQNESETSDCVKAISTHSDLVTNKYEGGLTVWECSLDLAEYLTSDKSKLLNQDVLELGCGAGIPGICAILSGASQVHYQDYNSEVVEYFTIPNVRLQKTCTECRCRFFSGDWSYFMEIIEQQKYDVIISAETIYNTDNYRSLHNVMKHCLAPDGVIYIAAKSLYYGVGGGVHMFEEFVKMEGCFNIEVCHTVEAVNVLFKYIDTAGSKWTLQFQDDLDYITLESQLGRIPLRFYFIVSAEKYFKAYME